jgi:sRNA-binding regulator protein Hfq
MRWERLFEELEAQSADLELDERDALVDELRDGDWAQTSWRQLLGGRVVLALRGVERVEGVVGTVNQRLVHLQGEAVDHVVNAAAILTVLSSERRADPTGAVAQALGWGQVLRALRDAGEEVRLRLVDGMSRDGVVQVVGRDFVRLRVGSGHDQLVLLDAIAVVSGRT